MTVVKQKGMIFKKAFCFGLNSFNVNVSDEQDGCLVYVCAGAGRRGYWVES